MKRQAVKFTLEDYQKQPVLQQKNLLNCYLKKKMLHHSGIATLTCIIDNMFLHPAYINHENLTNISIFLSLAQLFEYYAQETIFLVFWVDLIYI